MHIYKNSKLVGKAFYTRRNETDPLWSFIGFVPDNIKNLTQAIQWYYEV
jgi:hypothetical protein